MKNEISMQETSDISEKSVVEAVVDVDKSLGTGKEKSIRVKVPLNNEILNDTIVYSIVQISKSSNTFVFHSKKDVIQSSNAFSAVEEGESQSTSETSCQTEKETNITQKKGRVKGIQRTLSKTRRETKSALKPIGK